MSPFEGAQTTLHCLLDDDVPNHSGEILQLDREVTLAWRDRNEIVLDGDLTGRPV